MSDTAEPNTPRPSNPGPSTPRPNTSPRSRSFAELFFGIGIDEGDDASDTPAENRSPDEPSLPEPTDPRDDARTSAVARPGRSLTEAVPTADAEPGDTDAHANAHANTHADADAEADAHPSVEPPDILSLAEPFRTTEADRRRLDAASPTTPPGDRSLAEPISVSPPVAPNPWRRSADHEEREASADRIALLVSQWELGTVHRLHALAASHGLDVREFLVLSELAGRPLGLTASQLTGVVGGGAARMSVLLRGLEERGLVERDPDPSDRRSVLVGTTGRAHAFLPHRMAPDLRRVVRQEFSGHDQADAVVRFVSMAASLAYRSAHDLREVRRCV